MCCCCESLLYLIIFILFSLLTDQVSDLKELLKKTMILSDPHCQQYEIIK
jgi:hypothetical protein